MLIACKQCHKEYVVSNDENSEAFVCSKCRAGVRAERKTGFGLHPALELKLHTHATKSQAIRHRAGRGSKTHFARNQVPHKTVDERTGLPSIPGFELIYQIGRGAMGSVYRARQISTGRAVAIKVLSQELSVRSDLVARFEREAYALKALRHENVVSIIDANHVHGIHYFAMEFIDGMTLRARMGQGPLSITSSLAITKQMVRGLEAAHKQGIIHRDLKPENVLLEYADSDVTKSPSRVVLVDFGLVGIGGLAFDPHPNLTRSKVTMGTVNYMAPEQHIDAKRVDHRSDLYSAGVILYEMICGDLPLGRYLLPSERGIDVNKDLDQVLSQALARNSQDRVAQAGELYQKIDAILVAMHKVSQEKADSDKAQAITTLRSTFSRLRLGLLMVVAVSFFVVGIKLSLRHSPSLSSPEIEQKNTP